MRERPPGGAGPAAAKPPVGAAAVLQLTRWTVQQTSFTKQGSA